ncbi:hypothetical protein V8F20_011819 [Naviculisporaceae sp. PSN 640]
MSGMFNVPGGSSSPPATPDKNGNSYYENNPHPSTTPAGPPPPPSSAGSFTPAGAPSESFLGSSIMRGMTGGSSASFKQTGAGGGNSAFGFSGMGTNTGGIGIGSSSSTSGTTKNLFGGSGSGSSSSQKRNIQGPLGRSIRGKGGMGAGTATATGKPSRLSHAVVVDDEDEDEDEEEYRPPVAKKAATAKSGTFSMPYDDSYTEGDGEGEEEDEEEENRPVRTRGGYQPHRGGGSDEGDGDEDDLWLGMQGGTPRRPGGYGGNAGEESDLMMLNTPAATERVRREAEDIFRASSMQSGPRRRQHKFAMLAKDVYTQLGTAPIHESPELILSTEALVNRLYDDGVGEADDEEKLDDTLATAAGSAVKLWEEYADKIPRSEEEHSAEIGPGPNAAPFQKASYLANLALRVHHSRCDIDGNPAPEALPWTLFQWQHDFHNFYGDQMEDIMRHRPSPACHSLFWQTVFIALIRGRVADATQLLEKAGWAHVRRGQRGEYAYKDQALTNVERAVDDVIGLLETCPGFDNEWDIWSSNWTLFRVRAQGALEHLRSFAEGKDEGFGDSFATSTRSARGRESMAGLARRAESQVPWDIYENLTVVFNIVLGSESAILGAAQDWCEATIGLFGWLDEKKSIAKPVPGVGLSQSQALIPLGMGADTDSYLERLARAFHAAVASDFQLNSLNPVEIGMACVFEDNAKGLIGILRGWSLPIASAVAEIASLGKWLPPHQPSGAFALEDLDMDDLEVLGMDPGAPDEIDGIKDSTLVQYAQALADLEENLGSVSGKKAGPQYGWELAIQVLGRLDSSERSEEMVGILVKNLIENMHVDSESTVDKIWGILNELGMIPYAEETAETYGEILARDSHRYGEAMWYFALAHKPHKVREVMNLLISYSLIQSTAYPPSNELDDHLHRLLTDRQQTLENFAKQDIEAAELLGKMLSGYASLRQFYEIRDSGDTNPLLSNASPTNRRRQAAAALISVIASSDDNIRGGLLDTSRDGIVSEDFLLALLGEATVFVSNPDDARVHNGKNASPVITLEQIDVILKAIEDLQAVGERVYNACDEFLGLVIATAPGGTTKGSTPADLMRSVGGGGGSMAGSFELLKGSSMVASQLQKSLSGGNNAALGKINVPPRGWDWRSGLSAKTKGEDVMQRLRLGLAKDLASLWLKEADGDFW